MKRIAVTSSEGGGATEAPVRAQIAKALKKKKIKVVPQKKGGAPTDEQGWVALGQKLKVDGFVQLSFDGGHGKQNVEVSVRTGADGSVAGSETFVARGAPRKLAAVVGRSFWKKLGASIKQVSAARAGEGTGMPPRDLAHEPEATPAEPKPEATSESKEPGEDQSAPSPTEQTTPAKKTEEPEAEKKEEEEEEEEEEEPAAKPVAPGERRAARDRGTSAPKEPALIVSLQGRYLSRSFTYKPSSAAPVNSSRSPAVGAEVMWFPLTSFGIEVGGDFESWLKILGKYPSTMLDLHASLVYRLPLSFGDLYIHAGGFRHFFAVTDDGSLSRQDLGLPDTIYLGVRAGAGLRVRLAEALSLTVDGDYRYVSSLSGGTYPITDSQLFFPRAKAGPAFDGALTLAYRITPMLEIQAGGDIRRYAISTDGRAGDRIDASDATDLYLSGWLGLGGVFGGH